MARFDFGIRMLVASVALVGVVATMGCTSQGSVADEPFDQVQGPLPDGVVEKLEASLAEALELSRATGAIAGVWAPWAGEWTAAIGTAEAGEPARAASTDMSFRIGSQTSALSCTVLLRLVDDGVVELRDHVDSYVQNVPGIEGITLGQLCQHTSGIADYYPSLRPNFIDNPERQWPPVEVLANGLANSNSGAPGEAWAYSRTGLVLLGLALERRTGTSWPELYSRYIAQPLGLTGTILPPATASGLPAPSMRGYAARMNGNAPICDQVRDVSALSSSSGGVAAGAVSTLADMRIWTQALATGSLLSEKSHTAQWSGVPMGKDAPAWQQYGLGAASYGTMRGWAGDTPGFLSAGFTDPVTGLTVVVVLNDSTVGAAFVRDLAFALTSIAAEAPAAGEESAPLVELPWSEEQVRESLRDRAVCQGG